MASPARAPSRRKARPRGTAPADDDVAHHAICPGKIAADQAARLRRREREEAGIKAGRSSDRRSIPLARGRAGRIAARLPWRRYRSGRAPGLSIRHRPRCEWRAGSARPRSAYRWCRAGLPRSHAGGQWRNRLRCQAHTPRLPERRHTAQLFDQRRLPALPDSNARLCLTIPMPSERIPYEVE